MNDANGEQSNFVIKILRPFAAIVCAAFLISPFALIYHGIKDEPNSYVKAWKELWTFAWHGSESEKVASIVSKTIKIILESFNSMDKRELSTQTSPSIFKRSSQDHKEDSNQASLEIKKKAP